MKNRIKVRSVVSLAAAALTSGAALAQPTSPVYTTEVADATTGGNAFVFGGFRYWTVNDGADSYQNDLYERPTAQGFQLINGRYAANEYLAYIDIERARFGFDNRYLYAAIDVVGRDKRTQDGVNTVEGLKGQYGVRFGADPDGRNSIYLIVDQPESASLPNTLWTLNKTEGFRDTDRDVGGRGGPIHGRGGPSGLNVTKVDNPQEEFGLNGYDQILVQSDGLLAIGQIPVLWQRVSPTDNTVVEIAFDYVAAGLTRADLEAITYLHFEAQTGGLSDPQMGLWNDKFTGIEAGSPNRGIGSNNEFGTQGLGDIYEADTVRASAVVTPPPPPPPANGACCVVSACSVTTSAACAAAGGRFLGANSVCDAPCCAYDLNGDSILDIGDLLVYLNWFFAGDTRADTNADGRLSVDDAFMFLYGFFAGC
ncbi:MAG: GC-type dockerin domain-anchored protein [Phycisphaerales bacterium]